MGKPIVHEYGQDKTILKFFDFKGAACLVPATMGVAQADGKKIVAAGTPFPSNDKNALGVLLDTVDVTQGDAAGTYVYKGILDPTKLTVSISDAAKKAMPNVQIYGESYKVGE